MVFWVIIGAVVLGIFLLKIRKDYSILGLAKKIKTVNGADVETIAPVAKGSSIFGNNLDLVFLSKGERFHYDRRLATLGRSYIKYVIGMAVYNIITAKDVELILKDTNLITKGLAYTFLSPFIKTGLLTSTGQKWHSRRKMLTPAFHFNILEQFLEIFKEESHKFNNILEKNSERVISLTDLIPRLTLNTICETALGVKLDNLKDGDTYRDDLVGIENALIKRTSNPLYFNDFIWKHFGNAKEFQPSYDGVHRFSNDIIQKRRTMFQKLKTETQDVDECDDGDNIFFSKKRRYAMLDTLLMAEKDGLIDHQGICEEVDTFIFEGFDTTSMGLIYGIMNLSLYPEIQRKCFEEVQSLIDDDLTRLTIPQINKLEYLERFVKETLRMYPSVPIITRKVVRDTALANNILLPKGSQIAIHIYDIQRDPKHFNNPNEFDPDRFLPENASARHPYAFVPFSAGSRNCIGQKFAMLEMKTVLINVLKNFKVIQVGDPNEYEYESGFLLRVSHNIKVHIERRK